MTHRIEIRYCVKCRWLLRSTWMAQELLSTFEDELDELFHSVDWLDWLNDGS